MRWNIQYCGFISKIWCYNNSGLCWKSCISSLIKTEVWFQCERERKNGLKIDWNWVEWIMINFDRTIDRCRCTIKTDFHIVVTSSLDEDKINFPFVHRFPSRFTRFHVTAEPNDNLYSRAITSSGVHFNCNQCVRMQSSIWSAYFSVWFINHHSR